MPTPLVSICLPNLNTRPFLAERMETILTQTANDWELIICDSYSTDGSWDFFQQYKHDPRISMFQAPRAGTPGSWNYCLERVRGKYVYVATSDDTSYPTMLEKLVMALDRHPDVDLASCNFDLIDDHGQVLHDPDIPNGAQIYGDWLAHPHRRHGISEFVASCVAGHIWTTITAVLFRRSLLDKTGLFPANRGAIGDYEWALRACLCTDTMHIPESLATWRVHRQQATKQADFGLVPVAMIQSVLSTFRDRLPFPLRTSTARSLLTWPWQVAAFNRLQLYPTALCKAPGKTLRHLVLGLTRQPWLTINHLRSGALWKSRPHVDAPQYVKELLAEFQLPPICTSAVES